MQRHHRELPIDLTEPVGLAFGHQYEIAFRDFLAGPAFDTVAGQVLGVCAPLAGEFSSGDHGAAAVHDIKQFRFLLMNTSGLHDGNAMLHVHLVWIELKECRISIPVFWLTRDQSGEIRGRNLAALKRRRILALPLLSPNR